MSEHPGSSLLAHQRSHRVTPRISLHTFSASPGSSLAIQPSQHVTLQFPPDLDPIWGSRGLTDEDRRLSFTPYRITLNQSGSVQSVHLLSGNGRVTGLLGLPRPRGLNAEIVEISGGFSQELISSLNSFTCIAGGTGVTGFLAMASSSAWQKGSSDLLWTIRGDDFPLVEYYLSSTDLNTEVWERIKVFVTAGEDTGGFVAGKSSAWWADRFRTLKEKSTGRLEFYTRRFTIEDVNNSKTHDRSLLFCGSKSLQWQIKMWALGSGTVYCTDSK